MGIDDVRAFQKNGRQRIEFSRLERIDKLVPGAFISVPAMTGKPCFSASAMTSYKFCSF